jgi:protoporphyrinogen oxidase
MSEVLIIGAGPAGLTAAYEAMKLGMQVTVLEADDQVGGLSRTVNYRGYRFDIGGHRFFSKSPFVNALWHELLGEDLLLRPRLSRIYYHGHFFKYPLQMLDTLTGLGPREALHILLSYIQAKLLPSKDEVTFEQWVSNRFGKRLYDVFFKTYTQKVWGIPCSEISADWAAQRIKNLTLYEVVRNLWSRDGRAQNGQIITTLNDQFYYPRFGPGMMWEHCEQLLKTRGATIIRGVRVQRIRHQRGHIACVYGQTNAGEEVEFTGDHIISTMPLRDLINAFDPAPTDSVIQAAQPQRYRAYLTVALIVKRAAIFPDNWLYVHAPEVKLGRIQNYKNWSPDMVSDQSRTSLGLEYFLWDKDAEWQWSQDRLIELGIRECAHLGLITPDEVEDGTVVRMQKAYPVYDQLYHESITTIRQYLASLTNLQTIGRNGLHRYNNQDHSMLTGVYAARNIVGEKYDIWSVNTERDYHEAGQEAKETRESRLVPRRVTSSVLEISETPGKRIYA